MGRISQLTKVGIGFVSLWLIVYVVVYVIFLFSEGEPADLTDIDHTTGGGIRAKLMHMVLPHAYGSNNHNSNTVSSLSSQSGQGSGLAASVKTGSGNMPSNVLSLPDTVPTLLSNPFLSSTCNEYVDAAFSENMSKGYVDPKKDSIAVIIPVRNECPEVVIHTIKSIYHNSGSELKTIVLVDDVSDTPVLEWPHWEEDNELQTLLSKKCTGGNTKQCLRIVRPRTRLGVSGSKHYGASIFTEAIAAGTKGRGDGAYHDSKVTMLVFVDAHVVVSKQWLIPLVHTLEQNPSSIVYPQIDVIDRSSGAFVQSDDMIGSFDWSLKFKWELLTDIMTKQRIPVAYQNHIDHLENNSNTATLSPASPGILAISTKRYSDLNGFDASLKPYGTENIELSLRVWLCGGTVIRQSCSRVAHRYDNLFSDSIVSPKNGISQKSIDKNVMAVAEHWFTPAYREIIYKARFSQSHRVPYSIPVAERRMPAQFAHVIPIVKGECQDIQWYLENVYPGLLEEVSVIEQQYNEHIQSNYLETLLKPVISQYGSDKHAPEVDSASVLERVNTPEERAITIEHDSLIPKAIYNPKKIPRHLQGGGHGSVQAPEVAIFKSDATGDPHEQHANKVRETMICEDEVIPHGITCADRKKRGECETSRYYMIFGCPKTCGLCGVDGKMCVDFFEHKCPGYEREGRCSEEKEQMQHDCRFSCGFCQRLDGTLPEKDRHKNAVKEESIPAKPAVPLDPENKIKISPYIAQQQYANVNDNRAKDQYTKQPCSLKGRPHGNLLDRIHLSTPQEYLPATNDGAKPVRIFCGIYTQAKNHATNVQATKDVWAKKCDGFLAFSTATDESIPALKIEHEGKEEYDNMWVKSKSIWKYISQQYIDDFDFFLMGGDDMFYIIENLRFYLNSKEIRDRIDDKHTNGLFLGRRFYPPKQQVFNSGGAGYILDRKSLQVLKDNLDTPKCYPHQHGFWEDVNIANCLRVSTEPSTADKSKKDSSNNLSHNYKQILPYDTRDSLERERFHPFTPGQHLTYQLPKPGGKDWYKDYNPYLKLGYECCSDRSVSFHYVPADLMRTLNSYMYKCPTRG